MKTLKAVSLFVVITSSVTALAQHEMHDMNNMGGMSMAMPSHDMLDGLQGEELETQFLSGMIGHHEGAIDMAQWILERTQNAETKEAAEAIIAAQGPEIQQMTQWLEEWYGQGVDEESAAMMQAETDAMMQAMAASNNPDAAFLEQMSLHHNGAIDMAQAVLIASDRPELRELAKTIIVVQAEEIARYQTWLDSLEPTSQVETADPHAQH